VDEIGFAASFKPSGPVTVQDVLRRQLAMPDRAELEADRRERAEAAAREERAEAMRLANYQFGDPLGQLTRSQMAAAEARDRVRALEDELAEARKVLHRCAEEYVGWQEQAEQVTATAARSAPHDLLGPAKAAHQEFVSATRAKVAAMGTGAPQRTSRRPFGGEASRSEPVTCKMCLKYGATPEQSFLIHNDPAPEPAPAVPSEDERAWLDSFDHAERRTPGRRYPEISR
jgi:hypothetical protein